MRARRARRVARSRRCRGPGAARGREEAWLKAVVVGEFGGPEQLQSAEVADPVPGPGEVRVAVSAAGVNPVDAGNRADGSWAGLTVPSVLGYDIAGVVESVGPGVTGLAPSDRVMAMTHFRDGAGGYAELAVVDAGLVAPIGPAVSFTAAAATPLAAGPRMICWLGSRCARAAACWCWAAAAASGCSCCRWRPRRGS
jgi:NADPH:quinone reductase-like Zn-dependent oxidoreductase